VRRGIADANDCARQLGPLSGFGLPEFIMHKPSLRVLEPPIRRRPRPSAQNDRKRFGAAPPISISPGPEAQCPPEPHHYDHQRATKGRDELL
jgi:hypothetical protein